MAAVALMVAILAGCGSDGADDTGTPRTDPDRGVGVGPGGTTVEEEPPVEVDPTPLDLPEAEVLAEVALPEGTLALDVDRVVAYGADPWLYRVDGPGQRKLLEQVDGVTGEVLRTVEIPVLVAFPDESQVDGDVLWLPVRHDEGGGTSSFGVIRFDLTAGTFAEVPMPSYVTNVDLAVGTAWATTEVGDTVEVHDLSNPDGDPDPTVRDVVGDEDRQLTIPAADGIYDCSFGSWGFTPLGTDERSIVDLSTSGCNAIGFDGGLAVTSDTPIAVLVGGEVERRIEVPVPAPVVSCDGPQQSDGAEAVVVCDLEPYGNNGVAVVRIGAGDEAEVLGEIGVDPRRGLQRLGVPTRWTDGGVLAVLDQPDPDGLVDEDATYLVSLTGDEVTATTGIPAGGVEFVGDEVWLVTGGGRAITATGYAA